jgi:adenylate cyclase
MDRFAPRVLHFDRFTIDAARGRLSAENRDIELRPKSFDVLRYLVEHADRLIAKEEIIEAIWPDVVISDDSLARCMSDVRTALGDREQRIIKTMPRRGYMFVAGVREASRADLPLPDRPSIAVLPFVNLSDDPRQDFFAEGIAEDLITSLSKFSGLFVIARHSSFSYRGAQLDVRQIGRELGVRYLLVGSVRRDSRRVRVTAQLVDAASGMQLWGEHYDRALTGIFAVQDELTQKIIGTLVAHISRSELQRALNKPPDQLAAYECWLRGNAIMKNWHSDTTGASIVEAREFFDRARAIDPNYAPPFHGLAWTYLASWIEPWRQPAIAAEYQKPETLNAALTFAQRAIELDPNLADAHLSLGHVLKWAHRFSESFAEFERALEVNPNLADYRFGLALIHNGRTEEGMDHLKRIMRLDPFHTPACLTFLGNAYFLTGQYEEAIVVLRAAARQLPAFRPTYVWLAATAAQLGYEEAAREAAAAVLRRDPGFTIRKWLDLHQFARQADVDRTAEGLRKANLPE